MLDAKFFLDVGPEVVRKYREHITKDAKDVYGKKFKPYRSKTYEQRKRANKFKRQQGEYADSTAPVLTGELMIVDFGLMRTPNRKGFQMGWAVQGAKVKSLDKQGRVLTAPDQPLPKDEIKFLDREAHKYIKKGLGKSKTTRHRIGRK